MKRTLISVCIVTYNHEKYIRQCLEGVMMQKTDFDVEVIIGEDCSTDNTRSIVQEFEQRYPSKIKPIYQETNVGAQRNAYEFCMPQLRGDYIAICEGDDYWTDEFKLQKQVDFLLANPEVVLCYHLINSVDQEDKLLEAQQATGKITYQSWQEIFHVSIPTLSVVYKNVIKVLPPEMLKVRSGDTFLFGMLTSFGGAANLGFVGANYRKHAGGVFNQKSPVEQFRQSLSTRKFMKNSAYFNKAQKREIAKEIWHRKRFYFRTLFHKRQWIDCVKIFFS